MRRRTDIPLKENAVLFCNNCKAEKYYVNACVVYAAYEAPIGPPNPDDWWVYYRTWICINCGIDPVLIVEHPDGRLDMHPPRQVGWRSVRTFKSLAHPDFDVLKQGYEDLVEAFNRKLDALSCIGLRGCVEWIASKQGCDEGNLRRSIDKLRSDGHITAAQQNVLHQFRFLGNAAAHEMRSPGRPKLEKAIETLESIIDGLYEMHETATELGGASPP